MSSPPLFILYFGTIILPNQLPIYLGLFLLIGASLLGRAMNSFCISHFKIDIFFFMFILLVLVILLGLFFWSCISHLYLDILKSLVFIFQASNSFHSLASLAYDWSKKILSSSFLRAKILLRLRISS